MLDTDSTLYDMIAAPVLTAVFAYHSRPMLDTDSALYDLIAAPVLAAALHYRPMLDTDTTLTTCQSRSKIINCICNSNI